MLIFNLITSVTIIIISGFLTFGKSTYVWSPIDEWSPCSKPCGVGVETQTFVCLKKTRYRTLEFTDKPKCSLITRPNQTRNCSLGDCQQDSFGSYVWQVGNWSQCPKNCGGNSLQNRDVNCFLMTSKGQFLPAKLSKCNYKIEPRRYISCAQIDCPPKFLASKWGKCQESADCRPVVRQREVKCVSLLSTGKLKIQSPGICYQMGQRPLSIWMFCTSNANEHCLAIKKEHKKNNVIKIKKDNSEIHQMRHTKRLKIFVGQTAHILSFTRLSIFCPMAKMHRSKIKWQHGNNTYEYKGSSNERVKVNRKGVLVIKEFHLVDTGEWICRVGKLTEKAILRLVQPATGFDNWLKRHANLNYGMLNEESNVSFIRPEYHIWMKSEWSSCSVTCEANSNKIGYQKRIVTCEKIEAQYYKIVEDKLCSHTKPISIKNCKSSALCPSWKVKKTDNLQCSDVCVNVGVAKTNTNIICQHHNKTVDPSFCDHDKQPIITCPNAICQIIYDYGNWSQCSMSCSNTTNVSIRSRTMKCVWIHTKKPAYNLCQLNKLPIRRLTKSCRVPKCILGCKDLTPACVKQSKFRCRSSLFSHFCCAFCKKQFS